MFLRFFLKHGGFFPFRNVATRSMGNETTLSSVSPLILVFKWSFRFRCFVLWFFRKKVLQSLPVFNNWKRGSAFLFLISLSGEAFSMQTPGHLFGLWSDWRVTFVHLFWITFLSECQKILGDNFLSSFHLTRCSIFLNLTRCSIFLNFFLMDPRW